MGIINDRGHPGRHLWAIVSLIGGVIALVGGLLGGIGCPRRAAAGGAGLPAGAAGIDLSALTLRPGLLLLPGDRLGSSAIRKIMIMLCCNHSSKVSLRAFFVKQSPASFFFGRLLRTALPPSQRQFTNLCNRAIRIILLVAPTLFCRPHGIVKAANGRLTQQLPGRKEEITPGRQAYQ
jgi:hypothetical protein